MTDPAAAGLLRPGDHVCWTYDDGEQLITVAAELVRAGLAAGEKVLHYTDSLSPESLIAALDDYGVPVSAASAAGQLSVRSATETYRGEGRSCAASMAAAWARDVDQARAEGWPGVRMFGDMTWAARRAVDADGLAWYEAWINRIFVDGYATAVCCYDRRLFATAELNRITAAHPASTGGGAGPDDGWGPLLRFRRTTDPTGLRLCGQADASNRDALTAVLTGLVDEVTGPAGTPVPRGIDALGKPASGPIRSTGRSHHVAESTIRLPVTVDVSELTFADGAAARLLVRTAHAAPAGLRLAGCSPGLARLIGLVTDHAPPAGLVLEPA